MHLRPHVVIERIEPRLMLSDTAPSVIRADEPFAAATPPIVQAASLSSNFTAVVVDPVDRLATSRVLGDWNGATTDGWLVSNADSSSVAGGSLTATSQTASPNPLRIDL